MDFYCVHCRAKREGKTIDLLRLKNGALAMRAECEVCEAKMFRIGGPGDLKVSFRSVPPDHKLSRACSIITREMTAHLARHSWELYTIPHSFFEELIAEILSSFGFEVHLNVRLLGQARGDEADIIAFTRPSGMSKKIGYVVECKRFAKHRKVDLRIATHLYGLKQRHAEHWGLDRALLATTSTVTSDVVREYGSRWDFEISDHERIVEWLKTYSESSDKVFLYEQGLYRPAADLVITSVKLLPSDLLKESALQAVITMAAQSWPQLYVPGDPNTFDVYWHAGKVVELLGLQVPIERPKKEIGVVLVECVENFFIRGSLIRECSAQSLAKRGLELVESIQNQKLLSVGAQESYAVALYTWHGCICMAKLLRRTYRNRGGEAPYTHDLRLRGYNQLQRDWRSEDTRGNPWVRYGVSLARLLEKKRGNPLVENWVPSDSPYWDC